MPDANRGNSFRNRIVDHGEEAPDQLLANPSNFRVHPKRQQEALEQVLDEIGFVDDIIVNRRTGHLVDGHLRVELALKRGEATVPVKYVDLDENEERIVLATFDPLSAMAINDKDILGELVQSIETKNRAVSELLDDIAKRSTKLDGLVINASLSYHIDVTCADEQQQAALLKELEDRGFACRPLML